MDPAILLEDFRVARARYKRAVDEARAPRPGRRRRVMVGNDPNVVRHGEVLALYARLLAEAGGAAAVPPARMKWVRRLVKLRLGQDRRFGRCSCGVYHGAP